MSEDTESEGGDHTQIPVDVPDSRAVHSHQHPTAQHRALCSEPGLATRAGAGSEGSVQGVSCCPLRIGGVEESVMETKGRKYLPICPVTGHPPRMGTRLPTARVGINS